ncbi:MAG: glycosyltransferase [Sphingobacteriales bacterium]|nr:MAG: glycosyltransferase [Sphingobacteriales bacterium]
MDIAFYTGFQNKLYFKSFGLKEEQLVFAPHAVDNFRFAENRETEADKIRKNLKVGDTTILLLFAGKFEPKKNPILLLDAFLKSNRQDLHLLFTGNGVLETQLKLRVKEAGVGNVSFMDFQNQSTMPAVYQACDLFCLPSKGPGDTWGLAVNEAMAGGKAVLISDKVGCSEDLVDTNENGAVFESENETDLVEKINILCRSKLELEKMGRKSSEKIKSWSFDLQVEAFMSEFVKL